MNGSVMPIGRAPAEPNGRGWRLRPWPNDPSTALLVLIDQAGVPTGSELAEVIGLATRSGARRIRTSALFPRATELAVAAGFEPIDRLALLRAPLDASLDQHLESRFGLHHPRTRQLRRWHIGRAAALDRAAFGSEWGNDRDSLAEIRAATPHYRARAAWRQRRLAGFAISGAGGDSGYIQRLAVIPDAHRSGIGRDLVVDALWWMRGRRLSAAFVNTGVDNIAALTLYQGLGFERLSEELTIVEYTVGAGA